MWLHSGDTLITRAAAKKKIISFFNPPDSVQHAGRDVLSSGQTEHPDATDAAQRRLRDGGAAPGPVALHEVVAFHVLVLLRLLQNSVRLEGQRSGEGRGR